MGKLMGELMGKIARKALDAPEGKARQTCQKNVNLEKQPGKAGKRGIDEPGRLNREPKIDKERQSKTKKFKA